MWAFYERGQGSHAQASYCAANSICPNKEPSSSSLTLLPMIVNLPAQNSANNTLPFESNSQPIVIIGANGSGKTRMGYFIEQHNQYTQQVVRISSHSALTMPENATLLSLSQAEHAL